MLRPVHSVATRGSSHCLRCLACIPASPAVTHSQRPPFRARRPLSGLFLCASPGFGFGTANKMGRLPGGILDETRDHIIKELSGMNKSKLLKLSKSTQSSDVQGSAPLRQPILDESYALFELFACCMTAALGCVTVGDLSISPVRSIRSYPAADMSETASLPFAPWMSHMPTPAWNLHSSRAHTFKNPFPALQAPFSGFQAPFWGFQRAPITTREKGRKGCST